MDEKVDFAQGVLISSVTTWFDMSSKMRKPNVKIDPGVSKISLSTRRSKRPRTARRALIKSDSLCHSAGI